METQKFLNTYEREDQPSGNFHIADICYNKINNMLPTFNKCYIYIFYSSPHLVKILEKVVMIIFIIIFFMWADYKTGHTLPGNFLCLRIWLLLPSSGEEVSSISHCTAHSKRFSTALGGSLTLEVTNLSLSFHSALSKKAISSFRHFFFFSIMSTHFTFFIAGILSGQFVIFPQLHMPLLFEIMGMSIRNYESMFT